LLLLRLVHRANLCYGTGEGVTRDPAHGSFRSECPASGYQLVRAS
jgi:hypothetical protein